MGKPKSRQHPCSIEGCLRNVHARDMCRLHYEALTRFGHPLGKLYADSGNHLATMRGHLPIDRPSLPALIKVGSRELTIKDRDIDRFLSKVAVQPDGEWRWIGKTNRYGYGVISLGGRNSVFVGAHRFSYAAFIGPIPDGTDIDHIRHNDAFHRGECAGGPTCLHRLEVDPNGLVPRPRTANILGGAGGQARAMITGTCKWGHPLVGDNLKIQIRKGRPVRICRACKRRVYHEMAARRRAAR